MKQIHTLLLGALVATGMLFTSCGTEKLSLQKRPFSTAQVAPESGIKTMPGPQLKKVSHGKSSPILIAPQKTFKLSVSKEKDKSKSPKARPLYASATSSHTLAYNEKTPFKNPVKKLLIKEESPTTTNGFAIAGFVVSLVGLFVLGIPLGILAIVFSAIAMAKINKNKEKGKGLAIAGLVIGIVDIIGALIFAAMIL